MNRKAFTIIEVLVSILIMTTSIITILKIHQQQSEQLIYISERGKDTLSDSIFLATHNTKDEYSCKEIIKDKLRLSNNSSDISFSEYCKRKYNWTEGKNIPVGDSIKIGVNNVYLKDRYKNNYYNVVLMGR